MTGRISVFLALCVLGAAVLAAIALRGSGSEAAHLSPVPSFHVDIGSSFLATSTGNTYDAGTNLMSVPPITSCVSITADFDAISPVTRIVWTDIIIKNADEMTGADVRINYDPSKITLFTADLTAFGDVGLINLPKESGVHRIASPGDSKDNDNGAALLAGVYQGLREFDVSSESGPSVDGGDNILPDRNAGQAPDGGVFFRMQWRVLDQAPAGTGPEDSYDVLIDLTTRGPSFTGGGTITAGIDLITLTSEDPGGTVEVIKIPKDNRFDGLIRVNPPDETCDDPPQNEDQPLPPSDIDLFQQEATNTVGTSHTVTGRVTNVENDPLKEIEVLICVLEGPNAHDPCDEGDASVTGLTDSSGELLLTYTSNETGTDKIRGCVLSDSECSDIVKFLTKTWEEPPPPPPPPADSITLTPKNATNIVGTSHKVTATVTDSGTPVKGINVLICVPKGPNLHDPCNEGDATITGLTNANGQLVLTYTSNGQTGTDEIGSCIFTESKCSIRAVSATKVWVKPTPTPSPTPTPPPPLGEEQAPGGVPSTGNPGAAGGSGSHWALYALAASLLLAAVSGGGLLWMSRRRIAWPWRRHQSGG